ncbi:DNA-directed DNA polymerase alpha catalytic subunit pol1 [Phytophthora pseudosyringae]|uniref:DNA-directed DNA polymerase alpha catalytic subunit pol1 n=1 Tax=Phytophthora pseudosyringae TaxID=221518 RepID=A0A8T1W4M0_9STRA|nr:DNA-directed DNA polymerase alpha catalytic subunit pol1 [Phytophthora pseudosyringae]
MSDFTDDEDRQLVQLASVLSRNGRQILWENLTQQMKGTKKPKEVLRQRLKTLKRTHGRSLENFPAWFFKKEFAAKTNPQRLQASRQTSANVKADKLTKKSRYKRRRHVASEPQAKLKPTRSPTQTPTNPEQSPTLKMSPNTEPSASLLLLASVASTTGHAEEFVDTRCA